MPSYVVPRSGVAFVGYVGLVDQGNTKALKANPTLAAGDVKVSIDGGAFNNITTLPTVTPAGGTSVKLSLSAAEMTGDNITVAFVDAVGAEWCDLLVTIQTATRQVDDLAYPATAGRSLDVDASGRVTVGAIVNGAIVAATFAANALDAVWSTATRTLTSIADSSGVTTLLARIASALTITGGKVDVNDKTGFSLTSGERTAIANEVEAQIIDETDSEKVLTAITDKIASVNPSLSGLTLSAIASQVRTELTVELARIDAAISSRSIYDGSDTAGTTTLLARLTALRAAALDNLDAAISSRLASGTVAADVTAIKSKTDNLPADPASAATVAAQVAAVLTTALTESYAAPGASPTLSQAVLLVLQRLTEFVIDDVTISIKKLDGATEAATLTLDDATAPTSTTRAT